MPWMIPAAIIGSSLLGGAASNKAASTQADAAKSAADAQLQATREATALQKQMYEEGVARRKVYGDIGLEFTNRLAGMLRGGPEAAQQFLQMDPGYGFRISEGMKALDRQAAARGGLISGGALKAAQRYGQDVASQEFGNAFNRYGQFAALGPSSADITNELGRQYGQQAGQNLMAGGQAVGQGYMGAAGARSSGYIGGANALAGGLGQYLNYTQNQALLNRLMPQSATNANIGTGGETLTGGWI